MRQRRARRSRLLAAASVSVGFALVSLAGATPAQAAGAPYFEIFYGPGCAGGESSSRVYTGANSGEGWVDDTFNSNGWGDAGYGQRIRDNAASIEITRATVTIYTDGPQTSWQASTAKQGCFDFPDGVRNHNIQWTTASYGG